MTGMAVNPCQEKALRSAHLTRSYSERNMGGASHHWRGAFLIIANKDEYE